MPEGPPVYRFADADECRRTFAEAGFDLDSSQMKTVTSLWRVPAPETLFHAHLHAGVRIGAVLRAQPPERLEAIRAATVEGVRRYADGADFALPVVARVISARVGPTRRGKPPA